MTFVGPALQDVGKIQLVFPRQFTLQEVVDKMGWDKPKARQAIVMGLSQDYFRSLSEDPVTRVVVYENTAWRKQWITNNWGISDEWRELAG